MSYRARALSIIDTALRVPPLFIMDEVLRCSFGLTASFNVRYAALLGDENPFLNDEGFGHQNQWAAENDTQSDMEEYPLSTSIFLTVTKLMMFLSVFVMAAVLFMLNSRRLLKAYFIAASMAIVVAGYQRNMAVVQQISTPPQSDRPPLLNSMFHLNTTALWDSGGTFTTLVGNCIFQGSLGYLFTLMYSGPQYPVLHKLIIISFLLPSVSMFFTVPRAILSTAPLVAALLPLAIVKYTVVSNLMKSRQVVLEGYQYSSRVMHEFGLHSLFEAEWVRLNVPNVLRTFWIIRVIYNVVILLGDFTYARGEYHSLWALDLNAAYVIFKAVMTQGCETAVALLGMTSIVSYISHYVGVVFQMILLTVEDDERSMGTVCAILFFILAEQSGLTVMEAEKRFIRLCRNFCLLFTAMLHFVHNMVNPVLMSLSASGNLALYRHARALIVCSVLVFHPVLLLVVLWSFYPLSTWLLAVSAFSVQVIVKTLVSLLIYGLFLFDVYCSTFWEKLDDYVYYIKAFGNSVEFVFGILLFFNGAWIYFFESGGSIRAFMMCIHAYFNIWCEARNGWTVFMKRRTAVNKINSLPEATKEQLAEHDDVCAICFLALQSAKITKCKHYFHSFCLRKWLYVQDSCPLCHETSLYKTEGFNSQQVLELNEDENNAEMPAWVDQDIGAILDEIINVRNREMMMIDNEVGEAVVLPLQARQEDGDAQFYPQIEGQHSQEPRQQNDERDHERDLSPNDDVSPIHERDRSPENNQVFTLRSRRGHIIDQDIGQQ